jgi:hypothetical protein
MLKSNELYPDFLIHIVQEFYLFETISDSTEIIYSKKGIEPKTLGQLVRGQSVKWKNNSTKLIMLTAIVS